MAKRNRNRPPKPGLRQRRIIALVTMIFLFFVVWAAVSELEEVAIGPGRVIPSSQTQLVQSLEGGRVSVLLVSEGDLIEAGQIVATLDATQVEASLDELNGSIGEKLAQKFLLEELIRGAQHLEFPQDMGVPERLQGQKLALFDELHATQEQAVSDLQNELEFLTRELEILEQASLSGGATEIEQLRLRQRIASANTSLNSQRRNFTRDRQLEIDEITLELQQLNIRRLAQQDLLMNTEIRAPRTGTIQKIHVSTAGGGVVPPNGTVMEIVPLEDRLLIEARFNPRDIAFIAPAQTARIKVTAYDFSIYGDLEASVLRVSPDSFQDETRNGEFYFAVILESENTYFETPDGRQHPIIPGMVTTTEIVTGNRTILQYLLKPLRKASEALRER